MFAKSCKQNGAKTPPEVTSGVVKIYYNMFKLLLLLGPTSLYFQAQERSHGINYFEFLFYGWPRGK